MLHKCVRDALLRETDRVQQKLTGWLIGNLMENFYQPFGICNITS